MAGPPVRDRVREQAQSPLSTPQHWAFHPRRSKPPQARSPAAPSSPLQQVHPQAMAPSRRSSRASSPWPATPVPNQLKRLRSNQFATPSAPPWLKLATSPLRSFLAQPIGFWTEPASALRFPASARRCSRSPSTPTPRSSSVSNFNGSARPRAVLSFLAKACPQARHPLQSPSQAASRKQLFRIPLFSAQNSSSTLKSSVSSIFVKKPSRQAI